MIENLQKLQEILKIDYSPLFHKLILWFPRLLSGLVIFFVFWVVYRIIRFILLRTLKRANFSLTLIDLFLKVLKYIAFSVAILTTAQQWGIEIIPLLSTLGVIGIAVGLAAQQTVANVISGIIILISRPFNEGDWVELDNIFGQVRKISLRSTHLLTKDNLLVDYPNQKLVESKIINHTFNNHIRLRIGVGIAYKESITTAQQVLKQIVKDDPRLLKSPQPDVVVAEIADSSINLELQVWIKNSNDEIPIAYDLRKKVKLALDEAGIEIPFPHRQIFVENIQADGLEQLLKT